MIKVGILVNEFLHGGAQRIIVDIARRIDRSKFQLHVFYLKADNVFPNADKSLLADLLKTGTFVQSIGGGPRFTFDELKRLRRSLKREKPDIVHTFLPYAGTLGRVAARAAGIKRIISTQCNLPFAYTPKVYWLDRLTLPLAAVWTGATEGIEESYGGTATHFDKKLWDSGRRHFTVVAGVDVARIESAVAAVDRSVKRRELGVSEHARLVAMTARLISWKGHHDLITALARLPQDVEVVCMGWGPLEKELKELARSLGVEKRVHLLGSRADIYEILAVTDVYVQAHASDPQGRIWKGPNTAQMEACAAGVPSVSTAVPLVEELIEDGVTGKLVRPNDPEDLARGIQWMLEHPDEARRMASAARERVKNKYSVDTMVRDYESIYQNLMNE